MTAIERALEEKRRIFIYGDYDVDGVTSVSALYLYLQSLGAEVDYYIPSRAVEGYGVNQTAIDGLMEKGAQLVITVDNGITAAAEIEYAAQKGSRFYRDRSSRLPYKAAAGAGGGEPPPARLPISL